MRYWLMFRVGVGCLSIAAHAHPTNYPRQIPFPQQRPQPQQQPQQHQQPQQPQPQQHPGQHPQQGQDQYQQRHQGPQQRPQPGQSRGEAVPTPARPTWTRQGSALNLPNIRIPAPVAAQILAIADRYHQETGLTLVVTSGERTATSQADAIITKLRLGDNVRTLYARSAEAINQVLTAITTAEERGEDRAAAAARQIQAQMDRRVYLSNHLSGYAVDVRILDLTREQRDAILRAARESGARAQEETRPAHIHIQFPVPQAGGRRR